MAGKNSRKPSGYSTLSGKVTREYEKKGYSKKRASAIGHATAGKVAREKAGTKSKAKPAKARKRGR